MAGWVQPPDETRVRPITPSGRIGDVVAARFVDLEPGEPAPPWWSWPLVGGDVTAGWRSTDPAPTWGGSIAQATHSGTQNTYTLVWGLSVIGWTPGVRDLTPARPADVPPDTTIEWEHPTGESSADRLTVTWAGPLVGPATAARFYLVPPTWAPGWPATPPGTGDLITRADLDDWTHQTLTPTIPGDPQPYPDGELRMLLAPDVFWSPAWEGDPSAWPADTVYGGGAAPLLTFTYHPPRYRIVPRGLTRLRQRQSLVGTDSWPLRQRQQGMHSGSWPLRQRQRGI